MIQSENFKKIHKLIVEWNDTYWKPNNMYNVFYGYSTTPYESLYSHTWYGCQGSMPDILVRKTANIVFHVVTNKKSFNSSSVNNEILQKYIFNEDVFPFGKELWNRIGVVYDDTYTTVFFDQSNLEGKDRSNLGSHFLGLCFFLRAFGEWNRGPAIKDLLEKGFSFREAFLFANDTKSYTDSFPRWSGGHTSFSDNCWNWLFTGKVNKTKFSTVSLYSNNSFWNHKETKDTEIFNKPKTEKIESQIIKGRFASLHNRKKIPTPDLLEGQTGLKRLRSALDWFYKENGVTP